MLIDEAQQTVDQGARGSRPGQPGQLVGRRRRGPRRPRRQSPAAAARRIAPPDRQPAERVPVLVPLDGGARVARLEELPVERRYRGRVEGPVSVAEAEVR